MDADRSEMGPTLTDDIAKDANGQDRPGGRRRRLAVAAVAVGAFLLLIVLPGYLALRPGFFARHTALSAKYEPWSKSTHIRARCPDCHVAPKAVPQAAYRVRMVGEFYISLAFRSREPSIFPTPTNEACLSCHDDLRAVSPKGDVRIPHRAHVEVLKMRCVQCHTSLVHEPNSKGKYTPLMTTCLGCHDGDKAKDTCSACHTEKAVPKTHRAKDWTIVHPVKAGEPKAECAECHKWTERWCADCHTHRPASHGKDWRAVHGDRVKAHRSCEACHAGTFCERCHGEVPPLNLDAKLKLVK